MKHCLKVLLIASCIAFNQAYANDASESLLSADRALAAQSHSIGFVAALSKAMAPDAHKFDRGSLPAIGRDSIMALMAKYEPDLKLDWTPEEAVVAKSGELGYTWGHYVATSHNEKGVQETSHGVYMDVWRRDNDGIWRWIADMGVSTPAPDTKSGSDKSTNPIPTTSPTSDKITEQTSTPKEKAMAKVLGLGGIFFKSQDPAKLGEWYKQHLGMPYEKQQGAIMPAVDLPAKTKTVWSPFSKDTKYFEPSTQPFMLNLIVDNLDEALAQAKEGGATILGEIEDYPYGRFGRFMDPEGNKVELWQLPK